MIRTILIDDEQIAIDGTTVLLEEFVKDVSIIGTAKTVIHGIEMIEELSPDLVILDIHFPDGSGFNVIDAFPNPPFEVLFHTAYSEYAISAIRSRVLDYLLKPVSIEDLNRSITQVRAEMRKKKQRLQETKPSIKKIALNSAKATKVVLLSDVVCFEADRAYTKVHLACDEVVVVSKNLKSFETVLQHESSFMRVHRSAIVNVSHITEIARADGGHILLSNGQCVNLPSKGREVLIKQLLEHGVVTI